MIQLHEGMMPGEYISALKANFAEGAFHNTPNSVVSSLQSNRLTKGWNQRTIFALNGIDVSGLNNNGTGFISKINSEFNNISLLDKVISGTADVKLFGATGDGVTDDSAAINTAVAAGNIIIQNGTFLLSLSIKIPSDRTVYLYNCEVKMADESYDNFFRNADLVNGNTNIKIIGLGSVRLNGNNSNNNDNYTTYFPGLSNHPPVPEFAYRYNAIFFYKVDNYEITGFHIYQYAHWCILMQKTSYGKIHDIYIDYGNSLTVNQDGIGLRFDSHNIEIYNIILYTGDDCFSAFTSHNMSLFGVGNQDGWNLGSIRDIYYHDINVIQGSYGSLFAFWAGDGEQVYNIRFENAVITVGGSIIYGSYAVPYEIAFVPPVKTDIHDFTFKNIEFNKFFGGSRIALFYFGQDMMDINAEDITNNTSGAFTLITDGADVTDNVKVNGVQVI